MKTKQSKVKEGFRGWIYKWMLANGSQFIDGRTGEVNLTAMVEAWEIEHPINEGTTLDFSHPAWEVAVEVKKELENIYSRIVTLDE